MAASGTLMLPRTEPPVHYALLGYFGVIALYLSWLTLKVHGYRYRAIDPV